MVETKDIKWGSYREFEGPFYRGKTRMLAVTPDSPHDAKVMAVLTSTEGGRADAINMYDRCIISVGFIQWCEAGQYSVSGLLGAAAEAGAESMKDGSPFAKQLAATGYAFTKLLRGKYRFYNMAGGSPEEVDTNSEQRVLFLLDSNGKKGTWGEKNSKTRQHAKGWASAVASVFEDPIAVQAQIDYTVPRLRGFLLTFAKQTFPTGALHANPWNNVAYAAYVSFAGNNPTWANNNLQAFMHKRVLPPSSDGGYMWDEESTIGLLKQLTFGKRIGIYPHRYNAIRPVLERLWDVDLPDFAEELKEAESWTIRPMEVQRLLVDIDYDLGSSGVDKDGVDGDWGKLSKEAMADFQRRHGLEETGTPDEGTVRALKVYIDALVVMDDNEDDLVSEEAWGLVALTIQRTVRESLYGTQEEDSDLQS